MPPRRAAADELALFASKGLPENVYAFARRHEADVELVTAEGEGACFTICFPAASDED